MRKVICLCIGLLIVGSCTLIALHVSIPENKNVVVWNIVQNIDADVFRPLINGTGSTLININTASMEELETLPGIGASVAKNIIAERDENGYFFFPEDLLVVKGIGSKTLNKIRSKLCFDDSEK